MMINPDAESFQDIFYPESLIQRPNRLQRLAITLSFHTESVVSVNDISEHCNEDFGLTFPRTKYEPNLFDLVSDTSAFDFPHIS